MVPEAGHALTAESLHPLRGENTVYGHVSDFLLLRTNLANIARKCVTQKFCPGLVYFQGYLNLKKC